MSDLPELISLDEFKKKKPKEKLEVLANLREFYSDKQIRETWAMNYQTYGYYIRRLKNKKTTTAAAKPAEGVAPQQPRRFDWELDDSEDENEEPAEDYVEDREPIQQTSFKPRGVVIDADYNVVQEIAATAELALVPKVAQEEKPIMEFLNVNGSIDKIRKRLEGILMILESEDADQFKLNISIFKGE